MERPNFLTSLPHDTTSIIQQMLHISKIYLVHYNDGGDIKLKAIYPSLDQAVEFMLSLMSIGICVNNVRNTYHQETKTWSYAPICTYDPFYCNLFEIDEYALPCEIPENCIKTYVLDPKSKKLCVRYKEELEKQPESFSASLEAENNHEPCESLVNFDTSGMIVY